MTQTPSLFIDGEAGTTGLQIRDRLAAVPGLAIKSIKDADRKSPDARQAMMASVDLAVLCLPDDAARQAVALADALGEKTPRILDASTAHRTASDWVYGFPELLPSGAQEDLIRTAKRVANPGCYATGAIALIKPLMVSEWFAPDHAFTINAVSGYTGGGKSMIADFESGTAPAFHNYALTLDHKHIPEILAQTGLTRPPLFVPSVSNFPQGMLVNLPVMLDDNPSQPTPSDIFELFRAYYESTPNSTVVVHDHEPQRLSADAAQGDDRLHIHIFSSSNGRSILLTAQLDNLGKGAAGAAVQNIKLMLGLDGA